MVQAARLAATTSQLQLAGVPIVVQNAGPILAGAVLGWRLGTASVALLLALTAIGLPLLSDTDRAVAGRFGVKRPGPLFNRRATFVIDTDRRVIAAFISELNMETHADRALQVLTEHPANT